MGVGEFMQVRVTDKKVVQRKSEAGKKSCRVNCAVGLPNCTRLSSNMAANSCLATWNFIDFILCSNLIMDTGSQTSLRKKPHMDNYGFKVINKNVCSKQPSNLIRLHLSKHKPRNMGVISQMTIVGTDMHTLDELLVTLPLRCAQRSTLNKRCNQRQSWRC